MTAAPRVEILTCLWRRHQLADIVLRHYAAVRDALAGTLTLGITAVGSEGAQSRDLAERHGAHYVEHANSPLGAKWNVGLRAVRELQPDAVVITGPTTWRARACSSCTLTGCDKVRSTWVCSTCTSWSWLAGDSAVALQS